MSECAQPAYRISRDDLIDAIGSLELRASELRARAGWLAAGPRLEAVKRAKHYDEVAERIRQSFQPNPNQKLAHELATESALEDGLEAEAEIRKATSRITDID